MPRTKIISDRTRIDIWMLTGLHNRMVEWGKDHGWTKTKIIEYAVAGWLNQRDMEVKSHGLAEVKQ